MNLSQLCADCPLRKFVREAAIFEGPLPGMLTMFPADDDGNVIEADIAPEGLKLLQQCRAFGLKPTYGPAIIAKTWEEIEPAVHACCGKFVSAKKYPV